jgi:ubiquinone/menaquinone biosynthesis C-methylase UbiE
MPEMSALLTRLVANPAYRLIAGRVVLPWALQGWVPAGQALEIGADSGAIAARLLTSFPNLQMVVTDYDPKLVAVARLNLARFGQRAAVQQADAAGLPFKEDLFDAVLSFGMLHHVGAWEKAVGEAIRVLRQVVHLDGQARGFAPLPKRWVVEQTFGTLMLHRRLARDYETLPASRPAATQQPT